MWGVREAYEKSRSARYVSRTREIVGEPGADQ